MAKLTSSKKTLLVIAVSAFLQSLSIIITPDFYINELIDGIDKNNEYYLHIKLLVICSASLGIGLSVMTYMASTLHSEESSKIMLKGVFIAQAITFILLISFLFFSPLKPPLFLIFLTLIFSIFAFILLRKP